MSWKFFKVLIDFKLFKTQEMVDLPTLIDISIDFKRSISIWITVC